MKKFNGISVNNIDNLLIAINSNNIDKLDYKNLKYEISKKNFKIYISCLYTHKTIWHAKYCYNYLSCVISFIYNSFLYIQ